MNNTPEIVASGKKPFFKPELRVVRYTPEEVVLASCKTTESPGELSLLCTDCALNGS